MLTLDTYSNTRHRRSSSSPHLPGFAAGAGGAASS
jgi:hypothetical protein